MIGTSNKIRTIVLSVYFQLSTIYRYWFTIRILCSVSPVSRNITRMKIWTNASQLIHQILDVRTMQVIAVSSCLREIIVKYNDQIFNIQWKWPDDKMTFLTPSTFQICNRYMWPRLLFIDGYETTWTARYIFPKQQEKNE